MFDSSWKVRSIWDGVKLEVADDPSPVVLHSFTHLDPDLPLCEVRTGDREGRGGGVRPGGEASSAAKRSEGSRSEIAVHGGKVVACSRE